MAPKEIATAPSAEASPSSEMARLKVAGAWSGALEVQLESWTLSMLRDEIARRSSAAGPGGAVNLICGGKVLKDCDGAHTLAQVGLKNNSKILATAGAPDQGKALNEELAAEADRNVRLDRLRAAAGALAERHADGSLPLEDYSIELEDQNGQKVKFGSETDRRGVMMGLMLHANGKSLIAKQKYKEALDVLILGEEAFMLCDPKSLEFIDNVSMLHLDIVWCYFMLRDISCLSVAGMRLTKARKGFDRSHGKDSTRFRLLQAGHHAELAIYLRLELLEGVAAYHSGNFHESRKALHSAQAKYIQLQVPDEALSLLMNMGYKERAAKRALRMTGQDIQSAVDFLVEERAKKSRRLQENIQRQNEIMEQKRYGTTPQNKAVDIQMLNELASIGFERYLAAEALRLNENDMQKALDLLTDPEKNCDLQRQIESRRREPALGSQGNQRSAGASGTRDGAPSLPHGSVPGNNSQQANSNALVHIIQGGSSGADDVVESHENDRDAVMEDELARELKGDAYADYDIDVTKEGEAIVEYLSLLDSAVAVPNGSS